MDKSYILELNNLRINIHLGVSEEERSSPQQVLITYSIFFDKLPDSCATDVFDENYCYFNLSKKIKEYCESKEFKLIEHLAYEIHKLLKTNTYNKNIISVSVTKISNYVTDFAENSKFTIKG